MLLLNLGLFFGFEMGSMLNPRCLEHSNYTTMSIWPMLWPVNSAAILGRARLPC